jgi:hypothetical protein
MGDNLQDPDKDAVDELKVGYWGPCGVLFMLFVMGMNKSAVFLLGLVSFVMLLSSFLPCHGLSVRGFLLTFCS